MIKLDLINAATVLNALRNYAASFFVNFKIDEVIFLPWFRV